MRQRRRVGPLVLVLALLALFFFGPGFASVVVDWLWFGEVGQRALFWNVRTTEVGLALVFGLALTLVTYLNFWIARRSAPEFTARMGPPEWQRIAGQLARQGVQILLLVVSLVIGTLGGLIAGARWMDWLRFRNAAPFPTADPVFHQNIGFYVFRYPFLQFVAGWLFTALVVITLATALLYYLEGSVEVYQGRARVADGVRVHLSILLGLMLLVQAWKYSLGKYGLLLNPGGLVFGAGYTDLHARLPALNILTAVAIVAALGFFVNARVRALWLPGLALVLMVVANVTVGGVYPAMVQRFVVQPDEQAKERRFIQYHLDATRRAYALDAAKALDYRPGRPLSPGDRMADKPTLDNIRLWDYRILAQTYQKIQGLRQYYDVSNVDIDRYSLDGKYRQVMLAARELTPEHLEQRRWVNETLQYTHGYGLVMSAVNEADPAGRPVWLASDLPLETAPGLNLTRPQIYYGMVNLPPVIAPSDTREFDYATQGASAASAYTGGGGIPLSSTWLRALFAFYLGDGNIFITDQIRRDSRILIRRQVQERITAVAPFLQYDPDPYLAVLDGKMVWIQDAYTTASSYPYSEPAASGERAPLLGDAAVTESTPAAEFNYMRNSVKVTVDAYTGAVTFYAVDPTDPVLASYRKAFPGLFQDASRMPASLAAHLRYPELLFSVQSHKMLRFHVTDPDIFYARSDAWDVPSEVLDEQQGQGTAPMEPYYVVMRLPGEQQEEFAIILPFRTARGTTMTAWLAARCDGANYGQLRLYRFPAQIQVDSPDQVDNSIRADTVISQAVSLWNTHGSKVRYGNLLVLPVGQSLLYVKPLYVEATQQDTGGGIPELKRVILAERRGPQLKVVMEPTLAQALTSLIGGEAPETAPPSTAKPPTGPAAGPKTSLADLAAQAEASFEAADKALKAGDWAEYGRQIQRTRDAVRRMKEGVASRP